MAGGWHGGVGGGARRVGGGCVGTVDGGGGAGAVEGGSSGAVGGVGKWADVIMGSVANVGGGGGKAIAEGWYRGMCVESACGDCINVGIDAAAVEGGASVAIECATR